MSLGENTVFGRHLSVIYADDLRQEVDGKITIVGMYQAQMLVPAFPITLPKLAVLMTAVTPADQPFGKLKQSTPGVRSCFPSFLNCDGSADG